MDKDGVELLDDNGDRITGSNAPTDVANYDDGANSAMLIACDAPQGYVFLGWYYAGKVYDPGEKFVVDAAQANEEGKIVIYAAYEKIDSVPVRVTHITWYDNFTEDPVEGTNYKTVDDLQINKAIDIEPSTLFSRTGYNFLGWARVDTTDSEGNPLDGYELAPLELDKDDLYLTWHEADEDHQDGYFTVNDNGEDKEVTEVAADEIFPYHDMYAVWERQHFYVFHSSTGELEAIDFPTDDSTVDLTAKLSDGTLYGGYFKAYLANPDFATEENKAAAVAADSGKAKITDNIYDASATYLRINNKITLFWSKAQAYDVDGSKLVPIAEKVYYLREVPNYFLGFRLQYVYDWYYGNRIDNLFLMTSLDNNVYQEAGFHVVVTDPTDKQAKFYASYKIAIDDPNSDKDAYSVTINAESINKHKGGIVGVWDGVTELVKNVDAGSRFSVLPYWITLDGIRVDDPLPVRTFDIGDKTIGDTGLSEVTP